MRKGKTLLDAQAQLQALVKACSDTGKKGTLTIKLTVGAAEDSTVVLSDDISSKIPKPTTSSTVFYADEDGALFREDPKQKEFAEITKLDEAAAQ